MHTQKDFLRSLLAASPFLRPDQREILQSALPSMTDVQADALRQLLQSEDGVLAGMLDAAVRDGVAHGDKGFLNELETVLHSGNKTLLRSESETSADADQAAADSLFNDA